MGLSTIITNAISTIRSVTRDLLVEVTVEQCTSSEKDDAKLMGKRKYGAATTYRAALMHRNRFLRIDDTLQAVQVTSVQFVDPIPLKVRDRITLPDGSQPQIINIEGMYNPNGVYYAPKAIF